MDTLAGSRSVAADGSRDPYVSSVNTASIRLTLLQIVGFLDKMAREVDLNKSPIVEGQRTNTAKGSSYKSPFVFEPMRRKLHLP